MNQVRRLPDDFAYVAKANDNGRAIWVLAALTAFSGMALLSYGVIRPVPLRNLADTAPRRAPPQAVFNSDPSSTRQLAEKKNEAWAEHCEGRQHDCEIACRHYPKDTEAFSECRQYCDSVKESCMGWTHR